MNPTGWWRDIDGFICLNRDRILQIQGVHISRDFARVFKGLEKRAGINETAIPGQYRFLCERYRGCGIFWNSSEDYCPRFNVISNKASRKTRAVLAFEILHTGSQSPSAALNKGVVMLSSRIQRKCIKLGSVYRQNHHRIVSFYFQNVSTCLLLYLKQKRTIES